MNAKVTEMIFGPKAVYVHGENLKCSCNFDENFGNSP